MEVINKCEWDVLLSVEISNPNRFYQVLLKKCWMIPIKIKNLIEFCCKLRLLHQAFV